MISFIWAQDKMGNIGKENKMPWHLPADLKFFKEQTSGHTIVMGRKTYDSLGKALPNRRNLVLSRDKSLQLPDAEVVHDKQTILDLAANESVFICGGAEIYRLFQAEVDRLIVTKIDAAYDADTAFPEIDWSNFQLMSQTDGMRDEKSNVTFGFYTYERKSV
ncbi:MULTISPECIES: dihydrofolate reductase [Listeria]|uniref:dihydrofolate reductase n=1 Tax=Listeria TaxID=1637 RepID=UPI000B596A40|nr:MULTISPECIES: dihydrofolate reductase [Listeria]